MVYRQYRREKSIEISEKVQDGGAENMSSTDSEADDGNVHIPPPTTSPTKFKRLFYPVYILVWGADWLQGPFIYTLYKDEKKLPEETVATLFTTGFLAGAISAFFVGSLADRYGRRTACLTYCAITSLSCLSLVSNNISILFAGRALGGLGTTLMYTVFEAWMVTEYNQRSMARTNLKLSNIFGRMITLSSVVAVFAGLVGQLLVGATGTNTSPFLASIFCLVPAAFIIWSQWTENYGDSGNATPSQAAPSWQLLLGVDKRVLTLGLTSCCFEGSMYLFIFFWSPALKSSHKLAGQSGALPFGIIFASFMGAMMLGSMLFTIVMTSRKWMSCRELLQTVVTLASVSLLSTIFFHHEFITFWCFCVFELCVGLYFPCMAYQKGKIIDDGNRAHIYGLLRIPFNIFVVVALSLTREGMFHEVSYLSITALTHWNRRPVSRDNLHVLQRAPTHYLRGSGLFPA
ncbi:MAG: hypothetical protein Q9222_004525 [Ikaeria aurantiellina]